MSGSLLQFHISRIQIPASLSCLFQTTFCFKSFINLLSFISFSPEIGLSVCFHPSFIHPRTFTLLVRWWRWLVFTANVNADHLLVSALNKHSFNNNALETEKPQRIARLLLLLSFLSVHPSVNYFFFFYPPLNMLPLWLVSHGSQFPFFSFLLSFIDGGTIFIFILSVFMIVERLVLNSGHATQCCLKSTISIPCPPTLSLFQPHLFM